MALYIPHSIFHLARLLYVRPETFRPYYVHYGHIVNAHISDIIFPLGLTIFLKNIGKSNLRICLLIDNAIRAKVLVTAYFATKNILGESPRYN